MKVFISALMLIVGFGAYYMGVTKGIKSTQDYYFKKYQSDSIVVWNNVERVSKMKMTVDSIKSLYSNKILCDEN